MISLLLKVIIILSGLGIIIIIIRNIPRLSGYNPSFSLGAFFENFTLPAQNGNKNFSNRLEKFLRKIKILILKTENQVSKFQEKLRKRNEE